MPSLEDVFLRVVPGPPAEDGVAVPEDGPAVEDVFLKNVPGPPAEPPRTMSPTLASGTSEVGVAYEKEDGGEDDPAVGDVLRPFGDVLRIFRKLIVIVVV